MLLKAANVKVYDRSGELGLDWSEPRIIALLNGKWPWGFSSEWLARLTPEARRQAHAVFTHSLRQFVNEWIDSGKDAEDRESPIKRNVYRLPPGYSAMLSEVLLTNRLEVDVLPSGQYGISVGRKMPADESPESHAREDAIEWLGILLNSPASFRVARCNNPQCGRYYLRIRLRKKEIKRGTFCGGCIGIGSAQRTKAAREISTRKLIELAAEFWNKWEPSRRSGSQSKWVAAQMKKGLTGRWVTQHRAEIEAEVERRSHAQS